MGQLLAQLRARHLQLGEEHCKFVLCTAAFETVEQLEQHKWSTQHIENETERKHYFEYEIAKQFECDICA